MSETLQLNITIPVFNRLELTQQTITALHACRGDAVPFCITVVDNGSEPALVNVLQQLHQLKVIDNLFLLPKNMGISCAANIGWELAPAEYYMKLDNDIGINDTKWLSKLFELWRYGAPLSTLGPLWTYAWQEKAVDFMKTPAGLLGKCTTHLPGAGIIIPHTVHKQLGMWSEDYGLYGADDGDYGLRMEYAQFPQYYYIAHLFIEHLGIDGVADEALYDMAGLDKKQAHKDLFFEKDGSAGGMFRLNRYLYQNRLRTFTCARRYEIADIDKQQVIVTERKAYKPVAKALAHCRTLLSQELKRRGGAGIDEPAFKEQMATIMKACGQEYVALNSDAAQLQPKKIIPEQTLPFDKKYL